MKPDACKSSKLDKNGITDLENETAVMENVFLSLPIVETQAVHCVTISLDSKDSGCEDGLEWFGQVTRIVNVARPLFHDRFTFNFRLDVT